MKKLILLVLSAFYVFAGEINIAVAANVSYAIEDLKKEFAKTNPDVKVQVLLSSSGKLTAQIKNKAPFAIFMSANMKYPQTLFDEGLAITKPVVYARGSLAMFSAKKQDFAKGISLVDTDNIKKIAIANPKTAPYGKAALQALENANLYNNIEKKLVYAESISQTLSYAMSAADVGFIAKSSLYDPKMQEYKEGINFVDVDPKLYTPIDQGIVILTEYKDNKDAKAFYDFILSDRAKEIFKNFGYLVQ